MIERYSTLENECGYWLSITDNPVIEWFFEFSAKCLNVRISSSQMVLNLRNKFQKTWSVTDALGSGRPGTVRIMKIL